MKHSYYSSMYYVALDKNASHVKSWRWVFRYTSRLGYT